MSLFMHEWVALIRERWLKKLKRRKPWAVCLSSRERRKTFFLNNIISNFICCLWQLAAEDQFRREALDEYVISSDNPRWMFFIRIFTSIFISLSCKSSPGEVKWRETRWNNDIVWKILSETETKCLCGLCVTTGEEWQKQIEISFLYHPQTLCVCTSPRFYLCSTRQLKTTSCAFQLWHAINNFHLFTGLGNLFTKTFLYIIAWAASATAARELSNFKLNKSSTHTSTWNADIHLRINACKNVAFPTSCNFYAFRKKET